MMRFAALVLAGCALTSKSPPLEIRYFTPEIAMTRAVPTAPPVARLRLGRITPSQHLRGAIVHRDSAIELAPYETLRWSESPEIYVRRALLRALFEARPLDQAVGGDAPTLDVEVVAFEEVRRGTARSGRVELRYALNDGRRVLDRGVITAEHAAGDPRIDAVVTQIAAALEDASAQLGDRVVASLTPRPVERGDQILGARGRTDDALGADEHGRQ